MSGYTGGAFLSSRAKADRMARSLIPSRRAPSSRKVWVMLSPTGREVLTPWAAKQRRIRKARRKVARAARKANR